MINVLHLGLSYKCNMNCTHCYVTRKDDKLGENDYYNIIDTLYEKGLFFLYYTFGEPLCSELFANVSAYASKKNIVQILMTNGTLVNEEIILMLKQNNIKKVCVSLDHIDSEIHDKNRNYKGAYDKSLSSIKQLVEAGIYTGISVAVDDKNALCLFEIYELAKELHVNFISFLRERKNGAIVNMTNVSAYHDFFEFAVMHQNDFKVFFHDITLMPVIIEMRQKEKIDEEKYIEYSEMNKCHNAVTISIEANGDVKRCNLQNVVIGNILETSLKKLYHEEVEKYENIICSTTISK